MYSQAAEHWPCKINLYRLHVFLEGYEETSRKELLDGIRFGFRIESSVPYRLGGDYVNHKSASQFSSLIQIKIDSELQQGRIAGPFSQPSPGLILSPLASVPKREANEIRLIHDLSFPKGASVNEFIPREFCYVQYELIDHCLFIISEIGTGCQVSKADIKNAFRI